MTRKQENYPACRVKIKYMSCHKKSGSKVINFFHAQCNWARNFSAVEIFYANVVFYHIESFSANKILNYI